MASEEQAGQEHPLLRRPGNVEADRQADVAALSCWSWRQLRMKLSRRSDFAFPEEFRGLCGNEEFEKVLDEIRLTTGHPAAASLWSEMLVKGALGRNN